MAEKSRPVTLDQEIEGSNPSSPATSSAANSSSVVAPIRRPFPETARGSWDTCGAVLRMGHIRRLEACFGKFLASRAGRRITVVACWN